MLLIRLKNIWRKNMTINKNYEVRNIGGINVVVPIGGNMSLTGVITLNETALFVWNALKDDLSENELIDKVCSEYDAPREVISTDIKELLEQFKKNDLLK